MLWCDGMLQSPVDEIPGGSATSIAVLLWSVLGSLQVEMVRRWSLRHLFVGHVVRFKSCM